MSKSLLSGPKFNQTHQAYIDGAVEILEILKNDDAVKKIMLGVIEPTSPGNRHCKIRSIEGNLVTIAFRDVGAVQVIRVVVAGDTSIIQKIEEYANKINAKKKLLKAGKPKKHIIANKEKKTDRECSSISQARPTLRDKWPVKTEGKVGIKYYGEPTGKEFENRVHVGPDCIKPGEICCFVKNKKIPKKTIKYIFFPCIIKKWLSEGEKAEICYLTESRSPWKETVVDKMWLYAANSHEIAAVKASSTK